MHSVVRPGKYLACASVSAALSNWVQVARADAITETPPPAATETPAPAVATPPPVQTGNDLDFLHLTIRRLRSGPLGGTQFRITSAEHDDSDWTHGWIGFAAN